MFVIITMCQLVSAHDFFRFWGVNIELPVPVFFSPCTDEEFLTTEQIEICFDAVWCLFQLCSFVCLYIWWVFRFDVNIHVLGLCFKPLCLFVLCYWYRSTITLHLLRPSLPNAGGMQRVLVPKISSFKTCSLRWTHHRWSRKRQIKHNHPVLKNLIHKHNRMYHY